MDVYKVLSIATTLCLFLLGILVNNTMGRIKRLEESKMSRKECNLKHQLDEERIGNLTKSIEKVEKRNSEEHDALNKGINDIYSVLDKVKECVYKLAGRTDKQEEEPAI